MNMKWSLLLLSLIGFSNSYPIVSYRLLEGPNGKKVLILGDFHDKVFVPNVKAVTRELSKVKLEKPLTLYMEIPESFDVKEASETIICMYDFVSTHASHIKSINVEPRALLSDLLCHFDLQLAEVVTDAVPDSIKTGKDSRYTRADQVVWNQMKEAIRKSKMLSSSKVAEQRLSVRDFLAYQESHLAILEELNQKYSAQEIGQIFEREVLVPFSKACKEIQAELGSFDSSRGLDQVFWELIGRCETPLDINRYFHEWEDRYLVRTDYMFFNAVMFDHLLSGSDSQLQFVLTGEEHAGTLARLCAMLPEWRLVEEKSAHDQYDFVEKELRNSATFTHALGGLVREVIKPFVLNECIVCPANEQLKCCVRCKSVKYCSVACQKKDWVSHKKVCEPVKVVL